MSTADGTWSPLDTGPFHLGSFSAVWIAAFVTYGVGDVLTTFALVYLDPLAGEANPVVRAAIEAFGSGGLVGLKLLVFSVCIGISLRSGLAKRDGLLFYGPPVLLAGIGAVVTLFNLAILVG